MRLTAQLWEAVEILVSTQHLSRGNLSSFTQSLLTSIQCLSPFFVLWATSLAKNCKTQLGLVPNANQFALSISPKKCVIVVLLHPSGLAPILVLYTSFRFPSEIKLALKKTPNYTQHCIMCNSAISECAGQTQGYFWGGAHWYRVLALLWWVPAPQWPPSRLAYNYKNHLPGKYPHLYF